MKVKCKYIKEDGVRCNKNNKCSFPKCVEPILKDKSTAHVAIKGRD